LITGIEKGGGAEKMLLATLPHLKSAEHAVCVLKGRGAIGEELEKAGVKVFYLECSGWLDFGLLARYKNAVRVFRPDIQVNYLIHADLFGRLLAKRAGVRKVFSYIRNRHTKLVFKVLDFLTLASVDYLITNSQAVLSHYRKAFRFPVERSTCIPNGIDLSVLPDVTPSVLAAELGLGDEDLLVLSVARLHRQKDLPTLLRALGVVKDKNPHLKFKLLLAGEGREREMLETLAYDLGISDSVKFLGVRSDVSSLLSLADVFVLPSLHEGMSNALLEAMKEGKTCLVSDIPENAELIENEVDGLTFKAGDAGELARKLMRLAADPKEAESFGLKAKEKVARYGIDKIIENLEAFFTERSADKKKVVWVANDSNDIYVNFFNALGELHPEMDLLMAIGLRQEESGNEKFYRYQAFKFSLRWLFKLISLPAILWAKLKGKKADPLNLDFYFGLYSFLRRENPDLVMVNLYLQPTSWQALLYCLVHHKPLVLLEEKKGFGQGRIKKLLSLAALYLAAPIFMLSKRIFCYTSDCFNFGKERFPIFNKSKLRLCPAEVDTRLFYNQHLSKDDGKLKIITVARMVPFKRYEDLFRAAKSLQDRNLFDFVLNIRGEGVLAGELKQLIDDLKIRDRVNFLPKIPNHEFVNVYNQNDIMVLPSVNEPIGIVVPEAMACGLPAIVSDTCGAKTYVRDGENGFIFKTFDYFDLAEKIVQLYDPLKRRSMGEAAEKTIKESFDSRVVAERFYQDIKDLL
jgi:glycosyltransferase involved in cell wall biosynthesis